MPETAQVVVIGGWVIGASTLYHLAQKGCRSVVLLEKEAALGTGSTAKAAGGIRHQFSTETNIQLSLGSVRKFHQFSAEVEYPAVFNWVGYLFLLSKPDDWDAFQRSVALQQSLGVKDVRFLTPAEILDIVPQLRVDDLLGATYCPSDGIGDPYQVCQGYAQAARRLGAQIRVETEAQAIRVEHGRVCAVETNRGLIATRWVVNAAGPYAAVVARMAGVDVPIKPYRRQIFVTGPFDGLPKSIPLTVDFATGWYMRREGPGILMGESDKSEPPSFNTNVNWGQLDTVVEHALRRVPTLEHAGIAHAWAGLYDTTPDSNPILGPVPEVEGLLMAAGFSGHGFMHSPMTGQLMAEIILEGRTTIDISSLSVTRFGTGKMRAETSVV